MKYLITAFLVLSVLSYSVNAQTPAAGKVTGQVIDAGNGQPVDFATTAIINRATGKAAKAAQTNNQGRFVLSGIPEGVYTLKISFVGYQPSSVQTITITAGKPIVDAGIIKLVPSKSSVLKEVVVQGQRSDIQLGVDRKVFSVDQSIVSEGGSATDLLSNVPTVSVDIDGNVSLRGTSNVKILIDGKQSAIGGGDIASVLQSLPASSIENIELITNPSSKYDPEGQTGIINIVLKKNKKLGSNGSASFSAGNKDNYNASANFSYRDGRLNLYGNYSYRYSNRFFGGFSNTKFTENNRLLNNESDAKRHSINHTAKIGADYYIDDLTTIGVSGNLNFRNGNRPETINYLYQNYSAALDGTSIRKSDEDEQDKGYDLSLDFDRKFKRKGEELTANFSYGHDTEDENETFHQDFYDPSNIKKDTVDGRINDNNQSGRNYNIQADYTLQFNQDQKFEAGYRTTIRNDDESQVSDHLNYRTGNFTRDYNLTNDFSLDDIVHAVYVNYQNQITKTFGFQAGIRAEQAYLNTEYRNIDTAGMLPVSVKGKLNYFRVYPSIFFTKKLGNGNQFQLSYTRRVNRPRGWQVNPFRDISDPNNIRQGNPGLKPEDVHSFELSHMKYWKSLTFTSSLYFRQVNDVVEGIQQKIDSTTTLTQYSNLSRYQAGGLEFISRADFSKNFNLTANINVTYNKNFGSREYHIEGNSGYSWSGNLIANTQLPYNLTAQINMNYTSERVTVQGRSKPMFGTDAALKMDVLKKKGSLSLNVRDIFNSRKWEMETETADFQREFKRSMQGQMTTLTFSYRFGKTDQQQRRKNDRANENQQSDPQGDEF